MSSASSQVLAKYWKFFDVGLQNTFVYRWNFLLRSIFGIVPLEELTQRRLSDLVGCVLSAWRLLDVFDPLPSLREADPHL